MDQIVAFVSEKTGLSPEVSRQAVEATLNYLKTKLPAPIAGQLDALVAGKGAAGGAGGADLGDMAKTIGGMFSK